MTKIEPLKYAKSKILEKIEILRRQRNTLEKLILELLGEERILLDDVVTYLEVSPPLELPAELKDLSTLEDLYRGGGKKKIFRLCSYEEPENEMET